jgi:CheY-like chemotaxis protein
MSNSTAPVILCVDGEDKALWVRSLILSVAGYRVLTATTGEEALRMFRLNPVDVVIIDLWQPKSTGTGVVDQMKQIRPKVPVILLIGLADLPSGFEQADLLLTKCITPPELLAAISSVLPKAVQPPQRASTNDGIG